MINNTPQSPEETAAIAELLTLSHVHSHTSNDSRTCDRAIKAIAYII